MSLQFVFTQRAFRVDQSTEPLSSKEEALADAFQKDRFQALFDIGLEPAERGESPSLSYLRSISERFLDALTSMPELELLRERAAVSLSEDTAEELLNAVPFGIGTEYITEEWLNGIFSAHFLSSGRKQTGGVSLCLSGNLCHGRRERTSAPYAAVLRADGIQNRPGQAHDAAVLSEQGIRGFAAFGRIHRKR